jgi:hypothetical protein
MLLNPSPFTPAFRFQAGLSGVLCRFTTGSNLLQLVISVLNARTPHFPFAKFAGTSVSWKTPIKCREKGVRCHLGSHNMGRKHRPRDAMWLTWVQSGVSSLVHNWTNTSKFGLPEESYQGTHNLHEGVLKQGTLGARLTREPKTSSEGS